jgi:hypothetical protein
MNKELIIGGFLIAAAAIALVVFRGPSDFAVQQEQKQPTKIEQKKANAEKSLADTENVGSGTKGHVDSVQAEESMKPEMPVVRVNGTEIFLDSVIPQGFVEPGEPLSQARYDSFVNTAINRVLVMQKAEELGIMSADDFKAARDDIRNDLAEADSDKSIEEIDWEANYLAATAVFKEVYRKEGLLPRSVTTDEVNEYYNAHSADYEWVREKEKARGISEDMVERRPAKPIESDIQDPSHREAREKHVARQVTKEDRIERRVKDQIRRELREPLSQEAREKQRAYLDALREQANIEYLQ